MSAACVEKIRELLSGQSSYMLLHAHLLGAVHVLWKEAKRCNPDILRMRVIPEGDIVYNCRIIHTSHGIATHIKLNVEKLRNDKISVLSALCDNKHACVREYVKEHSLDKAVLLPLATNSRRRVIKAIDAADSKYMLKVMDSKTHVLSYHDSPLVATYFINGFWKWYARCAVEKGIRGEMLRMYENRRLVLTLKRSFMVPGVDGKLGISKSKIERFVKLGKNLTTKQMRHIKDAEYIITIEMPAPRTHIA